MMIFNRTREMHATYTVGMTRGEAEAIVKLVYHGLKSESVNATDRDIGQRYLNFLHKAMAGNGPETPQDS